MLNALREIFQKELGDENLEIDFSSSAHSVEKWDSVNNLIIISSIEEKFDVEFPIDVIFKAQNVGDLCDYIVQNKFST